jgi:hypothetical protein
MHDSTLYLTLQEWEDLLKLNQPVLEEYGL